LVKRKLRKEAHMSENHASRDALPAERMGDYEGRMAEFDAYTANFESIPAGMGGPDFFKGLPDDACQCEHWGYLFEGKFSVAYTDGHEEVVNGGEAYYMRPGHVFTALEDCRTIEFSPTDELQRTLEQVGKNAEAMQEGSKQ
jgi:hypothetical protein